MIRMVINACRRVLRASGVWILSPFPNFSAEGTCMMAKDLEAKRKKGCFSSETDSGYDGKLAWNKEDRVDLTDTSRNKSMGLTISVDR